MVVVARPRSIPRILKVDFYVVRRVRRLLVGVGCGHRDYSSQLTLLRYTYTGDGF